MKSRSVIVGLATWLVTAVCLLFLLRTEMQTQSSSLSALGGEMTAWMTGQHTDYLATSEERMWIAREDPIFVEIAPGHFRHVGHVTNADGTTDRDSVYVNQIEVEIYDEARRYISGDFKLQFHSASLSLDNVVAAMLPKSKRQEIAGLIQDTWKVERDDIVDRLTPVVRDTIRTAMDTVEEELPEVLRRHREEFQAISERYEVEIIKADLVPLVKNEILPIIEEEAVPVAEEIGKQLWRKVSLMSFAWKMIYDKSPLPRRDKVKAEFQRFVDKEVVPTLNDRSDELLKVTETIVKRSLRNPKVREVLKKNLKQVAEDRQLHQLIWSVIKEAVVDNEILKRRLEVKLRNEETKLAFESASGKMEEMVRSIADSMFGTRETGISPEFSKVLRLQLLAKDRRWLVMVPVEKDSTSANDYPSRNSIRMEMAHDDTIYPMGFSAPIQSPLTPQD